MKADARILKTFSLVLLIGFLLFTLTNLQRDVTNRNGNFDGKNSEIPPCQTSENDFLLVRDYYIDWKPGFNHKSLDLFNMAKLAVRLNRVLVDMPVVLASMHDKDKFGNYREKPKEQTGMWTWSNVYDLERAVFNVYNHGAVYKCRFRMTKVRDVKQLMSTANSVVTYDYFDIMFKQFTEETLQNSRTVVGRNQGFEVDPTVRYSSFFRAAALNLMENCAAKLKETSIFHQKELTTLGKFRANPQSKFYSIHVRLGDRECLRQLFTPKELISRLQEFKLEQNSYVYIMTDAPVKSNYWNAVDTAFYSRLCWAKDMHLFNSDLFSSNNYMVYIAEKALQLESDAFIESFEFATPYQIGRAKRLGNIAPTHCDIPGLPTAFPLIENST